MASLNKVFLAGNLTRDPEIRYTPSGDAVGDLQMAINRKFKGRDGQEKEETCYVGVVVWGRQAETSGEYLRKGSPILVEGRLQYEQWEKDGKKNSRLRVCADRVQFLGGPKSGAEFRDGPGGSAPRRSEPAKPQGDVVGAKPEDAPAEDASVSGDTSDEDNLPF
jgi:single-strand DNA-binding protein